MRGDSVRGVDERILYCTIRNGTFDRIDMTCVLPLPEHAMRNVQLFPVTLVS